jgi:hypothetical protein
MQGYIRVSPRGAKVALKWNSPSYHEDEHEKEEKDHEVARAGTAAEHGTR